MARLLLVLVLWLASINAPVSPANHCDTTIYVNGEATTENGCADGNDLARLRSEYGHHFLWVSRGVTVYVVTDAAVLREVDEAFRPQRELGRQQAELGRQQAELGARQSDLGRQQGDLGREQARYARYTENEAAQRELSRLQDELGRRQNELGRQQNELGRRQDVLGRKQEEAARVAERRVAAILDAAISRGVARQVR
jgi:multidrug efflux pump subunit AcrA (membrane-fusion protein)